MNNENDIIFSNKFNPLFDLLSNERDKSGKLLKYPNVDTVIITGGRASAKSYTVGIFSNIALVDYNWNILYTRYTNNSITDSVKPEVSNKLELLGFDELVNDTNTHIEYGNNRIAFKGIKTGSKQQTASLKSLSGFNCFVNDEAEELPDYATFKKIFYSIRSSELRNLNILILNPTSKEHWIYQEFFEKRGVEGGSNLVKDNIMYIHTSYLDVERKYIPDNIYNDYNRLKIENETEYNNVVLGGWIDEIEGILVSIKRLNFIDTSKVELKDTLFRFAVGDPANTGGDNYSMMFCWVIQENNQFQVVVKDIIYSNIGIEALTEQIIQKLHDNLIEECFLEANGVGLASYLLLKKAIENHAKITPFTTTENKEVKILSHFESIIRYLSFDNSYKEKEQYNSFIKHLTSYQKENEKNINKHKIDAIDNASMVAKAFKIKYAKQLFGK